MGHALPQADAAQEIFGDGTDAAFAAEFEGHHDIFQGRERGDELEILKDKADLAIAQGGALVLAERGEVAAREAD